MSPLLSGGGYSSEAIAFALGLRPRLRNFGVRQFAEQFSDTFAEGLSQPVQANLSLLLRRGARAKADRNVVICHSTPDAWVPSKFPGWDEIAPCPPPGARWRIGRTMFETDSVPADWVARCNSLDEVWVPTAFHLEAFARAGVLRSKLAVLGEPVDTEFFDPASHAPLPLSGGPSGDGGPAAEAAPFRFLSIFKWEERKGWDVLLSAFLAEFSREERVELVLKTRAFHSSADFETLIDDFATERGLPDRALWPRLRILDEELPLAQLPALYRAADAFVLPSRGEGWGRPHVEAMAMGLPVIATNWSGPTAYLSEAVGYPLRYSLVPLPEHMQLPGHNWAEPSVEHLRELLRHIFEAREEAKARGAAARELMARDFSPAALADQVVAHVQRLEQAERTDSERQKPTHKATEAEAAAEGDDKGDNRRQSQSSPRDEL